MTEAALTFEDWVLAHADAVAEARRVSVADIGTEPGEVAAQLRHVRRHFVAAGLLLQDAKTWVLKAHAVATQDARKKWPDYTADERKAMVRADPAYLAALKLEGDVSITVSALSKMHYEVLNQRRYEKSDWKAHDHE